MIFEPLPKLAPRADAIYRINCRPVAPGDVRFRARVKADSLAEPVNKEESTKVFGDEAPASGPVTSSVPPPASPVAPPAPAAPTLPSPAPPTPYPGGQE